MLELAAGVDRNTARGSNATLQKPNFHNKEDPHVL